MRRTSAEVVTHLQVEGESFEAEETVLNLRKRHQGEAQVSTKRKEGVVGKKRFDKPKKTWLRRRAAGKTKEG